MTTYDLRLEGCRPVPLAHYLKALGIFRLVAEQKDPQARGAWNGDTFVLSSQLDRPALEAFFLSEYKPTPIVAPWNGGSGFFPKDNTQAFDTISRGESDRFSAYRQILTLTRRIVEQSGLSEKPDKEQKAKLLVRCRNRLPDHALGWIDAAYTLTAGGPKYPPLLGTGGNDGHLEFSKNYMQRLVELFNMQTGEAANETGAQLREALFGEPCADLVKKAAIGQFLPASAGGANASSSFDTSSLINPLDYVLMLEGSLLFAAATARKMEGQPGGALAYPFAVRQVGAGYGSASEEDESSSRAEMWLPLWEVPARLPELSALFAEGRARVGRRTAGNGVDFVRALGSYGVDRGIHAFERYGFQVRNGLSYFATPLGRMEAVANDGLMLLEPLDQWIEGLRWNAHKDAAPHSVLRALRSLDNAIFALSQRKDHLRVQGVFFALAEAEMALAKSLKWTLEANLRPLSQLDIKWLSLCEDDSVEWRLAVALGSLSCKAKEKEGGLVDVPLRTNLEPVAIKGQGARAKVQWNPTAIREVVWSEGVDLTSRMNAVFARRLLLPLRGGSQDLAAPTAESGVGEAEPVTRSGLRYVDQGMVLARLADIGAFLAGEVDEQRLQRLIVACSMVSYRRGGYSPHAPYQSAPPLMDLTYSLMKLCFSSSPLSVVSENGAKGQKGDQVGIPLTPKIHWLARSDKGRAAVELAARRLHASGLTPAVSVAHPSDDQSRRCAAALIFPLGPWAIKELSQRVLRQMTDGAPPTTHPVENQETR